MKDSIFCGKITLIVALTFNVIALNAQKGNQFLGVEAGINFYEHDIPEMHFIRAQSTFRGEEDINLSGNSYGYYSSLKGEYFLSERFTFQSGIRYSIIYTSIHKAVDWSSKTDYFYVFANTEGNDSFYYKIKSIENDVHYLSLPLEFRYFIMPDYLFRLYVRVGADVGFKIYSQPEVSFKSSELLAESETIMQNFDKPNPVYLSGNLSIGWKIGRAGKPNFNIEAIFPTFFMNEMNSGLLQPLFGGGLRMSLQIPFNL